MNQQQQAPQVVFTGFVCKKCGGPSPVGVGFVDNGVEPHTDAEQVTACPCGHSLKSGAERYTRPIPDSGVYRQMADGHQRRNGHVLDAFLASQDGEVWAVVRPCCGQV